MTLKSVTEILGNFQESFYLLNPASLRGDGRLHRAKIYPSAGAWLQALIECGLSPTS